MSTSKYQERIIIYDLNHMMSITNYVAINVET